MSRIERVNETVKREVSLIVQQELGDPRLQFASITRAEVSRDLQHAKIYFSILGDQASVKQAENGFEAARGMVRRLLGKRLQMKFLPELNFIYDRSLEYVVHLDETIERLKNESEESS